MIDIKNEDCKITLQRMIDENKKIDVVLTSPFYNTNRSILVKERVGGPPEGRYDVHMDGMTTEEYVNFTVDLFNKFDKVLSKNGVILYNICYGAENTEDMFLTISNLILKTSFTVADVICWKKKSAIPNNVSSNRLTRIWEFVFVIARKDEIDTFMCNKKIVSVSKSGQNIYENVFNFIEAPNNDGSCSLNKATYSTDLCEQLLGLYAKEGSVVYDPFMGTGTTAVACKRMGFDCYGSEISENQVKFAQNRLNGVDVYSFKDSKNIRRAKSLFDA